MNKNENNVIGDRHAFLIMAYDNLYVLEKLLLLLDDSRNDIYLHLDKKLKNITEWITSIQNKINTNIFLIERKNVYWGDYTITEVILDLLQAATRHGGYSYYHHLAGTSLPLKKFEEIYNFFQNEAQGRLFFHINYNYYKIIQERVKAYYPFINTRLYRNSRLLKGISLIIGKFEILIGINRIKNNRLYPFYNGWQFFSIPEDFALFLISCREEVKKTFNYTLASDEVWIQTLAVHSQFRSRVYGFNGKDNPIDASKLFQIWKGGKPYIFTRKDYELLMLHNQNALWARKFDENTDKDIVDLVFNTLKVNMYCRK